MFLNCADFRAAAISGGMIDTDNPPTCPNCREPMRIGHVVPRLAGHPEIRSFQCGSCGEVIVEVEGEARTASALD
jgi:hypothetical protein